MNSSVRFGDYGFCYNCHLIVSRGKTFCNDNCHDEYYKKEHEKYEKRESRQKWLESLHARVKKFLERKLIHRLERKRALLLLDKIEDQFTTISWEIYEKRRNKNNRMFR